MPGFIDSISEGTIIGWAAENGQTAELEVHINGEFQYSFIPREERNDVVTAGLASDRCGFVITIPSELRLGTPCHVDILLKATGQPITGSPLTIPAQALNEAADPDISYFQPYIERSIEGINEPPELMRIIPHLMSWLSRAVSRADALLADTRRRTDELNSAIKAFGDIGGVVGHLYGLVLNNYPPMSGVKVSEPIVTIIIPVHNKFDLTYQCIQSVLEIKSEATYEIIVVDDCSTDETILSSLVFSGNITIVRPEKNLGFVGACNFGASFAQGKYLYFLNNDTIVRERFIDALVECFSVPNVGIAGSRLLFADETLQECGGIIWRDGTGWNWGRGGDKEEPKFSFMRDADYVSGAALMIPRALFAELNGFDRIYEPAYYEDTDLCFRVRAKNLRVVVQPGSTIIHLEGQSNGISLTSGLKRYQLVNHKKFLARWRSVLSTHRANGIHPEEEAERSAEKVCIFIDDTTPTPDKDAGSNAALEHMKSLMRLGFKVVFLPADNMAKIDGYTSKLQELGIECWYAPFAWSVEDYLRRHAQKVHLVYLHRKSNAIKYFDTFRNKFPGVPIIYNVADLHALREMREAELAKRHKDIIGQLQVELNRELDLARLVDGVIVHSTFERDLLRGERPDANAHLVTWPFHATSAAPTVESRSGLTFIGGYGHPPNVDAVRWLLADIWPSLGSVGMRLYLVGSHMPAEFTNLSDKTVEPTGYVEHLDAFLSGIRLTIAPLRYGAGLKGKVLTSFAAGVPCIMSPVAAEGMGLPSFLQTLIATTADDFVTLTKKLMKDDKLWHRYSQECINFVKHQYSESAIDNQMEVLIRTSQDIRKRKLR